ncbi:MAG: (2Fe-2S) ferredoxin domain-containing protein [Candidatus Omnitrophota bacterium]|nr:(2Fe-2S) ferredoxin domain-containing protein [Candidatus Omnitrophota bacterium]MDZ4243081.1 (2Fe-2S) ferredoxin domain-containing protein [Candidatus Omnitrophota bacterium]
MKSEKNPYEKQIFVCTNDRKGEKPSCGDQQGEAIFTELRRIAKERGLHPRIRVAQAKCLGYCSQGCNVMAYPDNVWHSGVTLADVPALAEKYLSPAS